jgi:hypothetical protein
MDTKVAVFSKHEIKWAQIFWVTVFLFLALKIPEQRDIHYVDHDVTALT